MGRALYGSSKSTTATHLASILAMKGDLYINAEPPSRIEFTKAIKTLKNGKAASPDSIPPKALKSIPTKSAERCYNHYCKRYRKRKKYQMRGTQDTWLNYPRKGTCCSVEIGEASCFYPLPSIEWQSPLYSVFVDFEKAFDNVDRSTIWSLLRHYGIPPKLISIIRSLYDDATCHIIHNGEPTDHFNVETGVRQGCILSLTIFLIVIDWIMQETTKGSKTGIQWAFTKELEDLNFADDI
ncbi:uncharacterized protein LOC133195159 [Saccostrea echinata]|uniref:uncharacterized protein LOC133195159 n=1 Tax=Saccostrea echinata TaxID=191078 RepID=UPI002A80D779|nr:uncharacterized protein LOC133195159 [Saccostrea echinata]